MNQVIHCCTLEMVWATVYWFMDPLTATNHETDPDL